MSEEVKWAHEIMQDGAVCHSVPPLEQNHRADITILQGKGMENPPSHPRPASIPTAMRLPPAPAEIMH